MEGIGAVYTGGAEAAGIPDQLQQTVKGPSPDREIRLPLMAPEAMEGRGREPEVKLIIMRTSLSSAGISCSER